MSDILEQALADLARPEGRADMAAPFLRVLPVSGAAVSTVGEVLGSETLSASDDEALHVDELQFDLGEGPCWDAMRTARSVLQSDIRSAEAEARWPSFTKAVSSRDVASIFAFPLAVGPLRFGAVDLYSRQPLTLDSRQTRQASTLASVVGRHVLRHALADLEQLDIERMSPHSRRRVHQATGMVLAQLGISPEDARLVLEGHAFAAGSSMMEVADQVLSGQLSFTQDSGAIEVAS